MRPVFACILALAVALTVCASNAFAGGRSSRAAVTSTAAAAAPAPAVVAEASVAPAHAGVDLRVSVGVGYSQLATVVSGVTFDAKSTMENGAFQAGLALVPNLFLHVETFVHRGNTPEVSTSKNATMTLSGVSSLELGAGPGVHYYFVPAGIYLGATLAYVRWTDSGGGLSDLRQGFGLIAALGKDWQPGASVGLGLAIQPYFTSLSEHGQSFTELGGLLSLSGVWSR
jgi:hypothetical protein